MLRTLNISQPLVDYLVLSQEYCLPVVIIKSIRHTDGCFVDLMGCKNTKYNIENAGNAQLLPSDCVAA